MSLISITEHPGAALPILGMFVVGVSVYICFFGGVRKAKILGIKLFSNMMYTYSMIEIKAERMASAANKFLGTDSDLLSNITHKESLHIFKNNQKVDFGTPMNIVDLVYNTDTQKKMTFILDKNNLHVPHPEEQDYPEKSHCEFISFFVKFEMSDEELSVLLKSKDTNFFVVGNSINKYLVWHLVKLQHGVDFYGKGYHATIIDHNANIIKTSDKESITINKDGYIIVS